MIGLIAANFVLYFVRVSLDARLSIVLSVSCSYCFYSTQSLSWQQGNNKLIIFLVTHLINIRSCFYPKVFSVHYFPFYQVLLQIAATFCKQSFLYFCLCLHCSSTAENWCMAWFQDAILLQTNNDNNCMDSWKLLPIRSRFIFERHGVLLWSDLFKYFLILYEVGIFRSNQFGLTAFPSNIPIKFNSGYIRYKTRINCWKHYSLKL